jgi:coenzyme F420-0:L-glutamate ligase / coenzyme F420-1:gamma-L-glutamate ligase
VSARLEIWGVDGIPEIGPGDDLAGIVAMHAPDLLDGDIVVVTSKVVSKSEGRLVDGESRDAAIDAETVRVVARRGATRIVETRHGFVLAAAGVDASNVPPGKVALLPTDPDASAARLRAGLRRLLRVDVGVLITDTMGRPWRMGLVDVTIGAAGVAVLDDHRGRVDEYGHALEMTVTALADEIAAAAELVKGKLDRVPVAIVRGLAHLVAESAGTAADLVRRAEDDMFRWGPREAVVEAVEARRTPRRSASPSRDLVEDAIEAVAVAGVVLMPVEADGRVVAVVGCAAPSDAVSVGAALERLAFRLAADGVYGGIEPPADDPPQPPAGLAAIAQLTLADRP